MPGETEKTAGERLPLTSLGVLELFTLELRDCLEEDTDDVHGGAEVDLVRGN